MSSPLRDIGRPRWPVSLDIRLPFLITALLIAIVAAVVWASYAEVKSAAERSAADRAGFVATTLASTIAASMRQRIVLLNEVAIDPAVVGYLSGGQDLEETARMALARLPGSGGETASAELWSPERVPVLQTYTALWSEPWLAAAREMTVWAIPDGGGGGPFLFAPDRVYFWAATPVRVGEREIGWVAQLLRTAAASGADQVEALAGTDIDLRLGSVPGDFWVASSGERLPVPAAWPFSGTAQFQGSNGESRIAFAQPVEGTSFVMIAEMSERYALARAHAFLSWVAAVAALVVIVGAVVALLLSRSVTQPLKRLRDASGAIATGQYAHRVELQRGDELGSLAETFNHMAAQVQTAHSQLESQFEEARALASELEHANAQLRTAMQVAEASHAQAQQASRAKSEFLATMSHEIRTPINAMIGYADLLEMGIAGPLTDAQRDHVSRITASGKHLVGLVDEVLDLAGIESGRFRLTSEAAPIQTAVETALAILRPQAIGRDIDLGGVCECGERSLYIGDPQRVEQIIVNLISNAVKFTPAGGRVRVSCGRADSGGGRWTQVRVEDTGVGISPEQLERIFEPFVQVETGYTREHGGVGLGLAISRHLALMMGGDIAVESRPGHGSAFTLRMPATDPAEADAFAPRHTA